MSSKPQHPASPHVLIYYWETMLLSIVMVQPHNYPTESTPMH